MYQGIIPKGYELSKSIEIKVNEATSPCHLRFLMNQFKKEFIQNCRLFGVFTTRANLLRDTSNDFFTVKSINNLLEDFEDECGVIDLTVKENQKSSTSILLSPESFFDAPLPVNKNEWLKYKIEHIDIHCDDKNMFIKIDLEQAFKNKNLIKELEKELLRASLRYFCGNRTAASRLLGICIRTIRNRIHTYTLTEEIPGSRTSLQ